MTSAPDFVEPVIAFRGWRVLDGQLVSPDDGRCWEAGVVEARCDEDVAVAHDAPDPACRCGLRVYFEPRSALSSVDYRRVLGIVSVWGRLLVHPQGVRAQFARVQALGSSPSWSGWQLDAVSDVAERLGVPLIDERALGAAAPEFGATLPASVRPPAR